MAKDLVNELYKFINSDKSVTFESLKTATDSAYAGMGKENEDILKEHEEFLNSSELFTKMPAETIVVSAKNIMAEWAMLEKDEAFLKSHVNESAPAGWEGTVQAMKRSSTIKKPYALSWYMKEKGYKANKADEGKLTANLANITNPEETIRTLAEKDKAEKPEACIKTANSGVTETPEKGRLQKMLDKETPNVDKLSDFKVAAKVETAKAKEPEITGVENKGDKDLKKEQKTTEGKLPADPSMATPDQIQTLAEEKALVTVSDENVANGIAKKYQGGRVVKDDAKKQFVIMVPQETQESVIKEETTSEPSKSEVGADAVPYVKDKEYNKLSPVSNSDPKTDSLKDAESNKEKYHADPQIGAKGASTGKQEAPTAEPSAAAGKADQNASKKRDDETQGDIQPNSDTNGQKTTSPGKPEVKDTNSVAGTKAAKADKLTPEAKVVESEVVVTPDGTVTVSTDGAAATMPPMEASPAAMEEPEMTEEETTEFAERVFVSDHLATLGEANLTEKHKAFIAEVKAKKMSKKSKEMVDKKVKAMKDKKNKK